MNVDALYTTLEEVIVVLQDSTGDRSLPIWINVTFGEGGNPSSLGEVK
jgi:hypothetical protein